MAGGKQTPRQKLIGMMYLVLTAMLALNVSIEAVEAFKKVDQALTRMLENYVIKNRSTYLEFDQAASENPLRAGEWRDLAYEVKENADNIVNWIHDVKIEIIREVEGRHADETIVDGEIIIDNVRKIDENNVPSQILIGADQRGKANDLRAMINEFREYLLGIVDGADLALEQSLRSGLDTDDPVNLDGSRDRWENAHFQALPVVAVITILSKLQIDIRNAETEVINFLFAQIDAGTFRFNRLDPVVIPNSNYIIRGNDYEARVFIAATDTTQAPEVRVGNFRQVTRDDGAQTYEMVGDYQTLQIDEQGRGIFRQRATTVGERRWGGLIVVNAPDGSEIAYPFEDSFTVAEPNAVISATAMNVLYSGIPNPIDISVPGIPSDRLRVTMTNGTIRPGTYQDFPGGFIAEPEVVGTNAQIIVSTTIEGSQLRFPPMEFRVRRIPPPIARFQGRSGGEIDRNTAAAGQTLVAVLEDFEFDLRYEIESFTFQYYERGGFVRRLDATNNRLTPAMRDVIGSMTRGQDFYFLNIRARGPDGSTRELPAVALTIG